MSMVTFRSFQFFKAVHHKYLRQPDQEGVRRSWMSEIRRWTVRALLLLLLQNACTINMQASCAGLAKQADTKHKVDGFMEVSLAMGVAVTLLNLARVCQQIYGLVDGIHKYIDLDGKRWQLRLSVAAFVVIALSTVVSLFYASCKVVAVIVCESGMYNLGHCVPVRPDNATQAT